MVRMISAGRYGAYHDRSGSECGEGAALEFLSAVKDVIEFEFFRFSLCHDFYRSTYPISAVGNDQGFGH